LIAVIESFADEGKPLLSLRPVCRAPWQAGLSPFPIWPAGLR
jgi:hypothetical protein